MKNIDDNFRRIDSTLKSSLKHGDDINIPSEMNSFYEYWIEKKGNSFAPLISEFHLNSLGHEIVDRSVIARVIRPHLDFVFIHWGEERTRVFGNNYNAESVRDVLPKNIARKARMEYLQIVSTRHPVFYETMVTLQNGDEVLYCALRLPLSETGSFVDQIITLYACSSSIEKISSYYQSNTDR